MIAGKESPPKEARRILIIEDNKDAANTMGELFKLLGYDVQVTYTGPEGLKVANEWVPAIVVSDIGLPELDGLEVARELRGHKITAGVRLIALTAYGTDDIRKLAMQAGFDVYITKPADFKNLQQLIEAGK